MQAQSDCETFDEAERGEEALDGYSIYTQAMKTEEWDLAYDNWKISYELAPAADGKRDHNYTKGVEILVNLHASATAERKKEIEADIAKLYNEAFACYRAGKIKVHDCEGDGCVEEKIGHLKAEYANYMYYNLRAPYSKNLAMVDEAIAMTKNNTLYTIFVPAANITVYQFDKEKIDAEKARQMYATLEGIYNANQDDGEYTEYYNQAWEYVKSAYKPIAGRIFDCEFFKAEFKPQFEADPENPELLRKIIGKLKAQECDPMDPFLAKVESKWKIYAAEENAKMRADFEAKNPGVAAKRLYDEGKFDQAIEKYNMALNNETDNEKKASYLFSKASIQFRKLKQYSSARETARKAAALKPGWGRPYMLIGDMYATSARSCGNDWNQRMAILAAIDKYRYARSIDSEVSQEANKKIGRYQASKPELSEGHMRGVSKGQTQKVGCWIGETVKVSFK